MDAIAIDDGTDLGAKARRVERQLPSHADPEAAQPSAIGLGSTLQRLHRRTEIPTGPRHVEIHHQPPGRIRVRRRLAPIEIRCQRDIARPRQAITGVTDLGHQPPPFLQHQHPGPVPRRRHREIARIGPVLALDLEIAPCHAAHLLHSFLPPSRSSPRLRGASTPRLRSTESAGRLRESARRPPPRGSPRVTTPSPRGPVASDPTQASRIRSHPSNASPSAKPARDG